MATARVHPIQLAYSVGDEQTCNLCGAVEQWTASAAPGIDGPALHRTLHLVHLVRAHLADVQVSLHPDERKKEVTIDV